MLEIAKYIEMSTNVYNTRQEFNGKFVYLNAQLILFFIDRFFGHSPAKPEVNNIFNVSNMTKLKFKKENYNQRVCVF